jgi:hypothetical protein
VCVAHIGYCDNSLLIMTLLIRVDEKHTCNVALINVISNVIIVMSPVLCVISIVITSIAVVSHIGCEGQHRLK